MRDYVMAGFDALARKKPLLASWKFAVALTLRFLSAALLLYPAVDAAGRGVDATHVVIFYTLFAVFALSIGVILTQTANSVAIRHELTFGKHKLRWVLPRVMLSVLCLVLVWLGTKFFLEGWLGILSLLISYLVTIMLTVSFYLPALDRSIRPQWEGDEV
ncbi:MAG: hypothetical protein AAB597_03675 [Patescibacteria group bacterium]